MCVLSLGALPTPSPHSDKRGSSEEVGLHGESSVLYRLRVILIPPRGEGGVEGIGGVPFHSNLVRVRQVFKT